MLFMSSLNLGFYATGKNSFLVNKNVLIITVSILINQDVFELSYDYNDLKFAA